MSAAAAARYRGAMAAEDDTCRNKDTKDPFTRGGAVHRSPPSKNKTDQDTDMSTVMPKATKPTDDRDSNPSTSIRGLLTETRERKASLGSIESFIAYTAKKGLTAKRVRPEDDEGEEKQVEIMRAIARLTRITADLVKIVSENANTKVEIKTGVRDLKGQIDHLNKKTSEWECEMIPHKFKTRAVVRSIIENSTQTDDDDGTIEKRQTKVQTKIYKKENSTQTEDVEMIDNNNALNDLKIKITSCNNYNRLIELLNSEWPEEAFTVTKVQSINPLTLDRSWDIALIAKPSAEKQGKPKGVRKVMQKCYPEALELLNDSEPGKVEYSICTFKSSKKNVAENERYVFVLPYIEEAEEKEQMYNQIQELKRKCEEQNRPKKLAVLTEMEMDQQFIRKILEVVFEKWDIRMLVSGRESQKFKPVKSTTETLVVKGEGTYADVLKKMKSRVNLTDLQQLGVSVKSVKKVGEGKVMMKVSGNAKQAEALKEKISNVLEKAEVSIGGELIFHISGIEDDVNKDEVKSAIEKEFNTTVQVRSLRPTKFGRQTATIAVKKALTKNLVHTDWMTIGWAKCRIRKRVNVQTCYKCWETGHFAAKCQGPDRTNLCRTCGKNGHKAVSCKFEEFCPLCEKAGHRAATTGCSKFREDIRKAENRGIKEPKGNIYTNSNKNAS